MFFEGSEKIIHWDFNFKINDFVYYFGRYKIINCKNEICVQFQSKRRLSFNGFSEGLRGTLNDLFA